jgi:hypothetical protein
MKDYNVDDFTFEALCLENIGPKIDTLAYLVGLVDSVKHPAGNPDTARYKILYPISEGEHHMETPEDLVDWSAQILLENYLPQTPVMFVQRWSPIIAMIENGFEPESLMRLAAGPSAVASGIWKPNTCAGAKNFNDCESDEDLFWTIMTESFRRAKEHGYLVNIIAQVGWSYDHMIGGLAKWDDERVAKSGRILWKRTWLG